MKTYLLTAAGVIFLSVIVSLLIPEGKLNKSIVFVMRMACIFVLIQPVTGIFKIKSSSVSKPLYDYEYICKVYSDSQSEQLEKLIAENLSEQCDCSVNIKYENGEFISDGVTVEVISEKTQTVDKIYAYLQEKGYINITVYAKSS